jgi:hypothetical protein
VKASSPGIFVYICIHSSAAMCISTSAAYFKTLWKTSKSQYKSTLNFKLCLF